MLLNATNRREAIWLLSAVVLAGVVAARRRHPVLRLVVLGHLATAFLYVLAAGVSRPETEKFIGYWYNDPHRLAAMLPITGVPLAVGGVLLLAALVAEKLPTTLPRVRLATSVPSAAVGLTLVLVGATGLLNPADREVRVAVTYPRVEERKLVTDEMRAFFARVAEHVPAGSVVAGNPFDGSVLLWALTGREVLFPHFLTSTSEDQAYLAAHLHEVATDPRVCDLARSLDVEYLLIGKSTGREDERFYTGIVAVTESARPPGLELVDSSRESRLYRLAACDGGGPTAANAVVPHGG